MTMCRKTWTLDKQKEEESLNQSMSTLAELPQRAKDTFHETIKRVQPVVADAKVYALENTDVILYACIAVIFAYGLYRLYAAYTKTSKVDEVETILNNNGFTEYPFKAASPYAKFEDSYKQFMQKYNY